MLQRIILTTQIYVQQILFIEHPHYFLPPPVFRFLSIPSASAASLDAKRREQGRIGESAETLRTEQTTGLAFEGS